MKSASKRSLNRLKTMLPTEKKKAFMLTIAISAILLASMYWFGGKSAVKKRPNIVFITSGDQSWRHTGINGDTSVKTSHFDHIAKSGVNFTNAFGSAPAGTPSRASILTGRNFWELEEAAIHFSDFPGKFDVFTDILADHGYIVGYTGKGWGPGVWEGHRIRDPSGRKTDRSFYEKVPNGINSNYYADNFRSFYRDVGGRPFFFWLGIAEPQRELAGGMGRQSGMDIEQVVVPGFLPDDPVVRSDLSDYYYEIQWWDHQIGEVYRFLEEKGELNNTLIVVTADNGMPFPRAKSNLYDYGIRLPLAISFGDNIKRNRVILDFINLKDLAPTFLEIAGIPIPDQMNGRSLAPLLFAKKGGQLDPERDHVIVGKELYAWCHPHGAINPVRGIRTRNYLYIRNLKPEMWPAGDPNPKYSRDLAPFGDVDGSPTKNLMLENAKDEKIIPYYDLAFGKRPGEELYDIFNDPFQLHNLAFKPGYQETKNQLAARMNAYLIKTGDPRTLGNPAVFDNANHYWSHGIETAGLPLYIWDTLSREEKIQKVDSVSLILQKTNSLLRQ